MICNYYGYYHIFKVSLCVTFIFILKQYITNITFLSWVKPGLHTCITNTSYSYCNMPYIHGETVTILQRKIMEVVGLPHGKQTMNCLETGHQRSLTTHYYSLGSAGSYHLQSDIVHGWGTHTPSSKNQEYTGFVPHN